VIKTVRNSRTENISKVEAVSLTDKEEFWRSIMIIDDDSDTTLTFKEVIENSNDANGRRIQVHTYNDPLIALSEFKPNLYDLLLIDINLPSMNGFELGFLRPLSLY